MQPATLSDWQGNQTFNCAEHGALRTSSVLGIRRAMMAVLRESAVCELVVILDRTRWIQVRTALRQWRKIASKTSWICPQQEKPTMAAVRQLTHELHASKAAGGQGRGWRQREEPSVENRTIKRLAYPDAVNRGTPEYMRNLSSSTHETTEAARKAEQWRCLANMRLILAALQSRGRNGAVPATRARQLQSSSASVCFLQWAFTEQPDVWTVPYPPVADLKQAVVLAEQRAKMADALHSLISEIRSLTHWSELVAETRSKPWKTSAQARQSTPLGVRLLRAALKQPLRRVLGSCFRALQLYHSKSKHKLPLPPQAPPEYLAIPVERVPRAEQTALAPGGYTETDPLSLKPVEQFSRVEQPAFAPGGYAEAAPSSLKATRAGHQLHEVRVDQTRAQRKQSEDHSKHPRASTVEAQLDSVISGRPPLQMSRSRECEESLELGQEAAATKIQARFRGRRTRSQLVTHRHRKHALRQNKEHISSTQATNNMERQNDSFGVVTQPSLPSGGHHQHNARPKKDGNMAAAAVRIQARIRGRQIRSSIALHRDKRHYSVQNDEGNSGKSPNASDI